MASHAFEPIRLSNGREIVTIASIAEAGSFLLTHLPRKRRRPKSYSAAIEAAVRGLGGSVEPATVRAALLLAIEDLAKRSRQ